MKCAICGNKIIGRGYNAAPVKSGKCCTDCYWDVVVPERIKQLGGQKEDKGKCQG